LFCAHCGSFMRPKLTQRLNQDGEFIYDYLCELKEKSKKHKCNMKRINGNALDRMVCEEIRRLAENGSDLMKLLHSTSKEFAISDQDYLDQIQRLRQSVQDNEKHIKNLTTALSSAADTTAYPIIISEISELTAKVQSLQEQIKEYESLAQTTALSVQEIDQLGEMMLTFVRSFDDLTVEQRRDIIRALIHRITWDGETIHILFFGSDREEILDFSEAPDRAAMDGLQMRYSCTSVPRKNTSPTSP
ncbi:MAG: recombinase zinc beta ribbon domain-containing protein, partial [Oscillospiraceae bacterium]|nr:recombinase zinc beta ribbon domain-containing protein [Oscillospiraceae bacterium]